MKAKILPIFWYRINNEKDIKELLLKFNAGSIIRNNTDLPLYSGEWVKICVNDFKTYFVKPTDTLDKIAKYFAIEKEKIIKDNELKTDKLYIGQRLKILDNK